MSIQTTYSNARANFATLLNEVTKNRETVIISRRGAERAAIIAESELNGLLETAHLLRSPKNAQRLFNAISTALNGTVDPQTLNELKHEAGFDDSKT